MDRATGAGTVLQAAPGGTRNFPRAHGTPVSRQHMQFLPVVRFVICALARPLHQRVGLLVPGVLKRLNKHKP